MSWVFVNMVNIIGITAINIVPNVINTSLLFFTGFFVMHVTLLFGLILWSILLNRQVRN